MPLAPTAAPEFSPGLRRLAFVLLGASFGLLYGITTMSGDISYGCYGSHYEGMCGVMTGLLNFPGAMLGGLFSSAMKDSLYHGFWLMFSVLLGNAFLCGLLAFIVTFKLRKSAIPVLLILLVVFVVASLFPIFFFR